MIYWTPIFFCFHFPKYRHVGQYFTCFDCPLWPIFIDFSLFLSLTRSNIDRVNKYSNSVFYYYILTFFSIHKVLTEKLCYKNVYKRKSFDRLYKCLAAIKYGLTNIKRGFPVINFKLKYFINIQVLLLFFFTKYVKKTLTL